jgi:anti-anti-sigma regulatory factor
MELKVIEIGGDYGRVTLAIAGRATVQAAGDLKKALDAVLGAADRFVLDLGAVTEADTAFIQVLCSAHATAKGLGKEFSVAPMPPGEFIQSVYAAGFPSVGSCRADGGCPWWKENES